MKSESESETQGMKKNEAVLRAAALRLRPILMTSIATALGALPIALALGAGAIQSAGADDMAGAASVGK